MGSGNKTAQVLGEREVDNPMLTDGLYYGSAESRRQSLKVKVQENAMTRLGALCYIKPAKPRELDQRGRRYPHHERAAARFKSDYEALFGSGVPALDNARPVVDRSPVAHDSGMAAKIDRGRELLMALELMQAARKDRLIACLVLCIPCGDGEHWRARQKNVDNLLDDLDWLSVHWGYKTRSAVAA